MPKSCIRVGVQECCGFTPVVYAYNKKGKRLTIYEGKRQEQFKDAIYDAIKWLENAAAVEALKKPE